MITTTSRIEDKKPSKFILPPMGILGIVPCAKDVDYITQDLAVSRCQFLVIEQVAARSGMARKDGFKNEWKDIGLPEKVGDEVVHKELGDRMERAATTASSLEAEQDSSNNNRTQSMAKLNEPSP
ncbi:hypothetical protein Tco_0408249 [Tanacetum coccineum]